MAAEPAGARENPAMAPKRARSGDGNGAQDNPPPRISAWCRGLNATVTVALLVLMLGQYTSCLRCAQPAQGPYGGRGARHGYQGLVTGSANVQLAHLPGALATVALLRTVTPLRTSDFFFVRGAQSRRVRLSCGCNSAQQAGVGPNLALTEQVDALSKYVSG